MQNIKQKAFTLVELIVVVTILAILATIGFVSYSSYLTGVRDTNRISQLSSISDGLNLYSTKNSLPLPEDSVEIQANGETIAYQGYAGSNTLETIDFTKGGQDPKDDQYFSYYLTDDRKYFQLMAFLEEADSLAFNETSPLKRGVEGDLVLGVENTHAADYEDRYPTVTGRKLGILTDTENTPIQEIGITTLALDTTSNSYIAWFTDSIILSGDSTELSSLISALTPPSSSPTSCKEALSPKTYLKDGIYKVQISGVKTDVYCDMTTKGGGWTLVHKTTHSAENLTGNLDTNEGTVGWDSDDEYRLSIDYWKGLSTEQSMAKNIRIDGLEWNDISPTIITTISETAVTISGSDPYIIFNFNSNAANSCTDGTQYWNTSCCARCVNYQSVSSYGVMNQPMLHISNTSYTGSAIEGAGGSSDANYHVMEKMGIFLK